MITSAQKTEARRFLEQNPDIRAIDLLIADLNGVYRGKRVYPDALDHVYDDGIQLAKSLFASDVTGATTEYTDIGLQTGTVVKLLAQLCSHFKIIGIHPHRVATVFGILGEIS